MVRIGVVGATGQVGAVMRRLLEERDFPLGEVRFFASARSAGTTLPFKGRDIVVEDAATADLTGIDVMRNATLSVFNETANPKFYPPELLTRMAAAGDLGRKSGRGFYEYGS